MVALNTIDQSELTLVHPNDPRIRCAQNLYLFWGSFLESPGNFSGPISNIQIEI